MHRAGVRPRRSGRRPFVHGSDRRARDGTGPARTIRWCLSQLPSVAFDFRVLLTSQGISALGAVSFTALPLLVLALTGSGLMMGIVGALEMLPDLPFGMVAGALADRAIAAE